MFITILLARITGRGHWLTNPNYLNPDEGSNVVDLTGVAATQDAAAHGQEQEALARRR